MMPQQVVSNVYTRRLSNLSMLPACTITASLTQHSLIYRAVLCGGLYTVWFCRVAISTHMSCSTPDGLYVLAAGGSITPGGPSKGTQDKLMPQVFISHTGQDPDARTFAGSILYPALRAAGLPAFIDFEDLKTGSEWRDDLERASTASKVVVVVLSRSYASRFWCMRELHLACRTQDSLGRQPTTIPVFYHAKDTVLQPEVVRERWGPTGDLYKKQPRDRQTKINAADWADNLEGVEKWQSVFRRQEGQSPAKDEDRRVALEVVRACMGFLPPEQPVDAVGYEDQLARVAVQLGGEEEGSRLGAWLYGIGKCWHVLAMRFLTCGVLLGLTRTSCQRAGRVALHCGHRPVCACSARNRQRPAQRMPCTGSATNVAMRILPALPLCYRRLG
jgi:hypothetical protein